VKEQLGGLEVHRVWVYPARNEGRGKRILNHLSFMASSSLVAIARRLPADVVVATSPPIFSAAAGLAVARARGLPFVYDVRDLWPDAIFALGQMRAPAVRRGLRWLERTLYRGSATVIPVSEAFVPVIRERGGGVVRVIPNGADLSSFVPGPADAGLRRELGWDDRYVVLYAGTLGMAHGLMRVVEAAERSQRTDILYVLIGEGADRPALEQAARDRRLDNLQILPLQPRSRMPTLYRSADACLVSLRPLPLFQGFIPSKIFEIMACGRPILAAVSGQALDLIIRAEAGVAVRQDKPESLVDAALRLRKEPGRAEEMGKNGRRYVEQTHDRRTLAAQYLEVLQDAAMSTNR
jgi:glycosyltransferase involved in cell wall biosynthesis